MFPEHRDGIPRQADVAPAPFVLGGFTLNPALVSSTARSTRRTPRSRSISRHSNAEKLAAPHAGGEAREAIGWTLWPRSESRTARNLISRQDINLFPSTSGRLPYGRDIAGEGAVLDGALQRCAEYAMGVTDCARGEAFGYQRRVPLFDAVPA